MKLKIESKNACRGSETCKDTNCRHYGLHSDNSFCKTPYTKHEGKCSLFPCYEAEPERLVTFIERYRDHNKEETIFGTVWMGFYTFTEFYGQALGILACEGFGFPRGLIYDGYWLVFLSPFVLAYWILLLPMILVFSIIWLLFWLLFIPLGLWSILIELPASVLNKKEIEHWKC